MLIIVGLGKVAYSYPESEVLDILGKEFGLFPLFAGYEDLVFKGKGYGSFLGSHILGNIVHKLNCDDF